MEKPEMSIVSENSLVIALPDKSYECSKGHRWSGWDDSVTINYSMPRRTTSRYCLRCLEEQLDKFVGVVTEVQ